MTPEGKVKKEIKDGLQALGAYFFMPVQTGFGARSVDILACWNGIFIGVEVKRPGGGVLTASQRNILQRIIAAGGIALVATSWEEVKAALGL